MIRPIRKSSIALLLVLLIFIVSCSQQVEVSKTIRSTTKSQDIPTTTLKQEKMELTSPSFKQGEIIPKRFTCDGENINPVLEWKNPPKDTKSFALIIYDPDAPGGTWIHWLVKDISNEKRKIMENQIPGIQIRNSFGELNFGGPCPPSGTHRYFFKLYALDVETFSAEGYPDFETFMEKHSIGEASLMGKFSRE